jgi:imidazole glycerol-phosphate synthase subunit HisH
MNSPTCVVIDYGIGNTFSVTRALQACGVEAALTGDLATIRSADRLILPGVGAFGRAADRLRSLGLDEEILRFVETGRPFLGICVGMQLLMTEGSEFGHHRGLDILQGSVDKLVVLDADGGPARVPLIGWYGLDAPSGNAERWQGTILEDNPAGAAFYFVHSFAVRPADADTALAVVRHGKQEIVAAVHRDNILGVQFHPERSGPHGLALLKRFGAM